MFHIIEMWQNMFQNIKMCQNMANVFQNVSKYGQNFLQKNYLIEDFFFFFLFHIHKKKVEA
jgi:hypothetical protein